MSAPLPSYMASILAWDIDVTGELFLESICSTWQASLCPHSGAFDQLWVYNSVNFVLKPGILQLITLSQHACAITILCNSYTLIFNILLISMICEYYGQNIIWTNIVPRGKPCPLNYGTWKITVDPCYRSRTCRHLKILISILNMLCPIHIYSCMASSYLFTLGVRHRRWKMNNGLANKDET